ncbi:hypothetical protein GCM10023186_32250 [Hymenobacter koreensis]|uniref:Glycosyltransferase n=2 Tax=Hymenobacter koreensis TaxID=1084523 RepID=A0ABP8J9J5_9BACT
MRLLVVLGIVCMAQFVYWFADASHIGYAPLFWLLAVSVGFKLLRMAHEWYHYVNVREPMRPAGPHAPLTVDVLTTACPGEPHAMIVRTLEAMQRIRYPHTSYLCDEGNDPYLRAVCERLGVVHVTRTVKVNAKAGNINNALRQATGECCVVLDPDHEPSPDFLDRVMPYFENPQIGFVQVVQAYGNQHESLVARGAAEQTYHFYGPLMMGMNTYGTAQAIGANCTFRRAALDSIGGHAAGLTEDMHTAMRLHAAGWKSVYVPEVLSRGLVPASLGAYYAQQLKWARGAFDLLFRVYPALFSRFSWQQKIHYFTLPLYFLLGVVALIDLFVPLASLWLSKFPWHVSLPDFAAHMLPLMGVGLLIRLTAQRWLREPHEAGLHLAGGLLRVGTWWIYTLGFVYTLLNVKVPYIPTPKEGEARNEWLISLPNLALLVASLALAVHGLLLMHDAYGWVLAGLALINAAIMLAVVLMGQQALLNRLREKLHHRTVIQPIAQTLQRLHSWAHEGLLLKLPRVAIPLAFVLVSVSGASQWKLDEWKAQKQQYINDLWLLTGDAQVHTGSELRRPRASHALLTSAPVSLPSTDYPTATGLVGLNFPEGPFPRVAQAELMDPLQRGQVPVLSWVVPNGAMHDTSWIKRARKGARVSRPILLRPLIQATSAREYRDTWRKLVEGVRQAGIERTVWVWTPPATDSIPSYFPGLAYVDWLAIDDNPQGRGNRPTASYPAFRRQVAMHTAFHHRPVLVLTSPKEGQTPEARTQELIQLYPEVKAVMFKADPKRASPLLAQNNPLLSAGK